MKKARDFENLLDECLERVIKGETIEQCLVEHPDDATELEPLLRTALAAREITSLKPRPEFRERASYQFQAAIREMELKKNQGLFGWAPQWATALIIFIALLLAGSGTIAASGNSMPDELLYQVKLATEAVRISLTPSTLGKAELYVKLADERVAEIIEMADKGKAAEVERTAERLNTQLVAMADLVAPGGERQMEKMNATLEAAPQIASEETPPMEAAEPAPTLSPRAELPQTEMKEATAADAEKAPMVAVEEVPRLTASTPVPAPIQIPEQAPTVAAEPGSKADVNNEDKDIDKQTKLKKILSDKATENQEALLKVLEKVPESVKPVLQQAIDLAGVSYEQAIRNLE